MKKRIPEFTTDDDAERFVNTADLAQYDLAGFKPVQFEFQAKTAQLNMRLPQALLNAVKESAKARAIPYTRLVRETLEELVADRLRSNLLASEKLRIGNIQLLVKSRLVIVNARSLRLTPKEQTIFVLFCMRNGIVITRESLLNYLYGDVDQPDIKTIDVLVFKLRKKLLDAGADHDIGTVSGQGYILQDMTLNQVKQETYPTSRNTG